LWENRFGKHGSLGESGSGSLGIGVHQEIVNGDVDSEFGRSSH